MTRILVLGCGSIGERHIRCITDVGGAEIVACDPREERLAAMGELYGVADALASYEDADLSDIDAVMVCTPTDQHVPQAMRAAEAGCHLFVEKPISTTPAGVDELIELCAKKRVVLQMGYVMRHHPNLKEVKATLDAGTIGPVYMAQVKVGYFIGKYRPEYARLYWAHAATGGGVLLDASHQLDYIQWLLGPAAEVSAMMDHYVLDIDPEVEDAATLILRLESGALVTLSFNNFQPNYKHTLEIDGEKGSIEWDFVAGEVRVYTEEDQAWRAHSVELERDDFYVHQVESFLAAMAGDAPTAVTGEDGKRALMVALAARESAKTGRAVGLG